MGAGGGGGIFKNCNSPIKTHNRLNNERFLMSIRQNECELSAYVAFNKATNGQTYKTRNRLNPYLVVIKKRSFLTSCVF